uniref:Uncharacterized protein n=1 Tax=Timema tahoe TaxID=61484 RepID=A0A7R9INN1_9NEOP|nr:unnamed protein product [Timema tahoe]
MDERVFPIKIEPEEDLKFFQQEIKLEMKTEIDLPIKSELEEGLQCYQKHSSQLPPLTFPLIKEELYDPTEIDLPIKSELEEGLQCYQKHSSQLPPLTFPLIKEELYDPLIIANPLNPSPLSWETTGQTLFQALGFGPDLSLFRILPGFRWGSTQTPPGYSDPRLHH